MEQAWWIPAPPDGTGSLVLELTLEGVMHQVLTGPPALFQADMQPCGQTACTRDELPVQRFSGLTMYNQMDLQQPRTRPRGPSEPGLRG